MIRPTRRPYSCTAKKIDALNIRKSSNKAELKFLGS
jgi:hypothetical protein